MMTGRMRNQPEGSAQMDEPKSLHDLFLQKLFRIPDYQRGYAWQRAQLKDFWEDLINLSDQRFHYTGVLTLKQRPTPAPSEKEFWLIDEHGYKLYDVVDGQQRLTTFVIFLQALAEFVESLKENEGKAEDAIYISDTVNLAAVRESYLFRLKPTGDNFRTYIFGYTIDNPSYDYLRYRILNEQGGAAVQEPFYTLNLSYAKRYFMEQLAELHRSMGVDALRAVYRTLARRFRFNEYIIKDEFDVFVAFETMNNRGKKLSDLELLKNRLIYLTTLYADDELDAAERRSLRETVNDAWKVVYHCLGKNKIRPLNDDDFLRAHWTMYFKYSRQTGRDYIRFLLEQQFTPQKVRHLVERDVPLPATEEQHSEQDAEFFDNGEDARTDPEPLGLDPDGSAETDEQARSITGHLTPPEIRDYVLSLKESAVHWFNSWYAELAEGMADDERRRIDRLNRLGMGYFRPLVMAVLKSEKYEAKRIRLFDCIERFIFLAFRMAGAKANYRSSEFYNAARELDRGDIDTAEVEKRLEKRLEFTFKPDGALRTDDFLYVLRKKFESGSGYYGWSGLRYLLYEYELSLLSESRQQKVDWNDLLRTPKDKVSIEHIYPQTETPDWAKGFDTIEPAKRAAYAGSLGNLLLLSSAINSSLQNDSFARKKQPIFNAAGQKTRNGYADGSHSEIEVSKEAEWGAAQIRCRGMRLLSFAETRWHFRFSNEHEKAALLFLDSPCEGQKGDMAHSWGE